MANDPQPPAPVDGDPGPSDRRLVTLDGAPDDVVEAIGRATEALEYVERARGHLYTFHQLTGRADFLFEEAADTLRHAGLVDEAAHVERVVVGRNVLAGRWTFQVVEEYERTYYDVVRDAVRTLEARHLDGRRHVHEARLKQRRRTHGEPAHEQAPDEHGPV